MPTPARLDAAIDRLRRSRMYTRQFLADLTPDEWFWSPPQFTTHIAWQVGHIAVAQYNLCLRRLRGRTADDEALISDAYIDAFKFGSKPIAGAESTSTAWERCSCWTAPPTGRAGAATCRGRSRNARPTPRVS
jgi:hypothetical protein